MMTRPIFILVGLFLFTTACATAPAPTSDAFHSKDGKATLDAPPDLIAWDRLEQPYLPHFANKGWIAPADVRTDGLPTRGADLDDALLEVVLICEHGCPTCRETFHLFHETLAATPEARISYENVVRFGGSVDAQMLFEQAHEVDRFWEAFDLVWGLDGELRTVDEARAQLRLPPPDTLTAESLATLNSKVDDHRKSSDAQWTVTPTILVNGIAATSDPWAVEKLVRSQRAFAWRVHDQTGLTGDELLAEVKSRNHAASKERNDVLVGLLSACEADDLKACEQAGVSLADGDHGIMRRSDALELFNRACDGGRDGSCWAARFLDRGESAITDAGSFQLCSIDYRSGCAETLLLPSDMIGQGRTTHEQRGCLSGFLEACQRLWMEERPRQDWLVERCDEGWAAPCAALLVNSAARGKTGLELAQNALSGRVEYTRVEISYHLYRLGTQDGVPELADLGHRMMQISCESFQTDDLYCRTWAQHAFADELRTLKSGDSQLSITLERSAPRGWTVAKPAADTEVFTYASGELSLRGWIAEHDDADDVPWLIYLHDSHSVSPRDWQTAKVAFEDGFNVVIPAFRGQSGNPGNMTFGPGEIADFIALLDYLQSRGVEDADIATFGVGIGAHYAFLPPDRSLPPAGFASPFLSNERIFEQLARVPWDRFSPAEWYYRYIPMELLRGDQHRLYLSTQDKLASSYLKRMNSKKLNVMKLDTTMRELPRLALGEYVKWWREYRDSNSVD